MFMLLWFVWVLSYDEVYGETDQLVVNEPAGLSPISPPVFPGAEGWGAVYNRGGRGGQVIKVTNLNDAGAGSFREALTTPGPRVVVFEVSGYITLTSKIVLASESSFLTVAGQTAPGGGVTITSNGFNDDMISSNGGTTDLVFRYLRFRPVSACTTCTSQNVLVFHEGTNNVMVDHCALSYARSAQAMFYNTNSTVQYTATHDCVSSETIKGRGIMFLGAAGAYTVHKNVFARCINYNPSFGGSTPETVAAVNNHLFTITNAISISSSIVNGNVNIIGNYANVHNSNRCLVGIGGNGGETIDVNIFAFQNNDTNCRTSDGQAQDLVLTGFLMRNDISFSKSSTPFDAPKLKYILPLSDLLTHLSKFVGSTHPMTDKIRDDLIDDLQVGIRQNQLDVNDGFSFSSFPSISSLPSRTDTDNDGMPDSFESAMGFNPNVKDDSDLYVNGYTRMDAWLNSEQLLGTDWFNLWPMPMPTDAPTNSPTNTPTNIPTNAPTNTPADTPATSQMDVQTTVTEGGNENPIGVVIPGQGTTDAGSNEENENESMGTDPFSRSLSLSLSLSPTSGSLTVPLVIGGLFLFSLILFILSFCIARRKRKPAKDVGTTTMMTSSSNNIEREKGRSRSASRSRSRSKRQSQKVTNYAQIDQQWGRGTEYNHLPQFTESPYSSAPTKNGEQPSSSYVSLPAGASGQDQYTNFPAGSQAPHYANGSTYSELERPTNDKGTYDAFSMPDFDPNSSAKLPRNQYQ